MAMVTIALYSRAMVASNSGAESKRVLIDPSLLLKTQSLSVLAGAGSELIISSAFLSQLKSGHIPYGALQIRPSQPFSAEDMRTQVLNFLESENIPSFSYSDVDLLDDQKAILERIVRLPGSASRVDADSLAFLLSNSVMLSAVRRPLDAFRRAGARIQEFDRRFLDEALHAVISAQSLDSNRFTTQQLFRRGVAKWLIVGPIGAAGGALGGVVGAVAGLELTHVTIRAIDP